MCYILYTVAFLLLFAPLARGSVQGWAVGVITLAALAGTALYLLQRKKESDYLQSSPGCDGNEDHPTSFPRRRESSHCKEGHEKLIIISNHENEKQSFFFATPLDKPILALAVLSLLSLIFSIHYYISAIAAVQLFSYLILYYLVTRVIRDRSRLLFLVYWIIGISTVLCLIGLAKRYSINPFPWWDYPDLPYPKSWISATFGNHNHLAGWLEMSMPLLCGLVLFQCHKKWLPLQLLLLLLQGATLILTQSRGGWIGACVAALFMTVVFYRHSPQKIRKWILLLIVLLPIALGALLMTSSHVAERLHTAAGGLEARGLADRVLIWQGTVDMIRYNPLTGTGPGTYTLAFPGFQPPGFSHRYTMAHNDYLQFIAELGLGLAGIILWMAIVLYRHGLRKMHSRSRLDKAVALGSLTGITAILVHSIFDFNLHIPANALLFTTLAALAVSPPQNGV